MSLFAGSRMEPARMESSRRGASVPENCNEWRCLSKIAARCRAAIAVVPDLFIGARGKERGRECARRPAVAAPSNKSALLVKSFDFELVCAPNERHKPRCILLVFLPLSPLPSPRPHRFHGRDPLLYLAADTIRDIG